MKNTRVLNFAVKHRVKSLWTGKTKIKTTWKGNLKA